MGSGRAGPCVVAIETLKTDAVSNCIRPTSDKSAEANDSPERSSTFS